MKTNPTISYDSRLVIDRIEAIVQGRDVILRPTLAYDGLEGIRDTDAIDFLYHSGPYGLEEALESTQSTLRRLITIEEMLRSPTKPLPDKVLQELKRYQNFSATFKEEYEWWGVEPGPAKEVIYELGSVVCKTANAIVQRLDKPLPQ